MTYKSIIEEKKERLNRTHRVGVCTCCDNWNRIREIEHQQAFELGKREGEKATLEEVINILEDTTMVYGGATDVTSAKFGESELRDRVTWKLQDKLNSLKESETLIDTNI